MNFGLALVAVQSGKMITRKGWHNHAPGLFVFQQVPATISVEEIVPNMQSLPHNVKDEFARRLKMGKNTPFIPDVNMALNRVNGPELMEIKYHDQLALVDQKNNITGWSPSTADALAQDWEIYE